MKKQNIKKMFWTMVLAALAVGLWFRQGPLAYFVAQQRDILLGRYTIEQMVTQIIVAVIVILIIWDIWTKDKKSPQKKKEDAFKTIAIILSVFFCIVVVDISLRVIEHSQYTRTGHSYHRRPNLIQKGISEDKPKAFFTYPNAPAGYPSHNYTFTTDSRGFRNSKNYKSCDVVALGDSFVEGSEVSDEEVWPVLFSQKKSWTVCNLGMAGTSIQGYCDAMDKFGWQLNPKIVLCMLYEGNDFLDGNFSSAKTNVKKLKDVLFRASPIVRRLHGWMIKYLGPINTKRFDGDAEVLNNPAHIMYPVSWLPMEFPAKSGNFYTFDLKGMLSHCRTVEQFSDTKAYKGTCEYLKELKQKCTEKNIRFVVIYAPDKPRLLLQANRDNIEPARLRAFASLLQKNPPTKEQILGEYIAQMDSFETAIAGFCREDNIEFISLTDEFRQKMTSGLRAYLTYDQHWSAEGHAIVADFLALRI
jgi:hypothetical protein